MSKKSLGLNRSLEIAGTLGFLAPAGRYFQVITSAVF